MKTDFGKKALISLTLLFVNLAANIVFVLQMPEQVPLHFDANMVCDRMGSRWIYIIFPAFFSVVLSVLYFAASRSKNKKKNMRMTDLWMSVCTLIVILTSWFTLFLAKSGDKIGDTLNSSAMWLLPAFAGALFTVIGNYLPTLKQNHVIGYRIGWTLNNAQCWKLTHQFAGRLSFIMGIVTIAAALIMRMAGVQDGLAYSLIILVILMPVTMVPLVYAYIHRNDK